MGAISSNLIVSFRWPSFFSIIFFFLSGRCSSSTATNIITSGTPIRDRDGESLVSAQGAFELGFFTPGLPGPNRYLGIWFRKSSDMINVVWVANPNNPLTDSSGILKISEELGLVLLDGEGNEVWSVPIESPNLSAELQDDGNFVVIDDSMSSNTRRVLWQSFVHPSNTLLSGLELKRGQKLRAWKNMSNPAGGDFWLELDLQGSDQLVLRQGSNIYWRSGLWDQKSRTFSNATELNPDKFFFYFTLNTSKITYLSPYNHTRLALKYTGQLQFFVWYEVGGWWVLVWSVPAEYCDIPASCGPNGVCMNGPDPPCWCLRGFRPASTVDWVQGDYRGGCIRETPLTCNNNDMFRPMSTWPLPMNGTSVPNVTEAGCRSECLDSYECCTAYSFDAANSTCRVWSEDLVGLNDAYYYDDALDAYQPTPSNTMYMRLAQSQGGTGSNQRRCPKCGDNVIPFPLSTAFDCGKPRLYSNIHCKNGSEITFTTINGRTSYTVTSVDAASRTLVIKAKREQPCLAINKVHRTIVKPDLHVNSPYYITNTTNILMLNCPSSVLPPAFWACNSSIPCQTYVEDMICFSPKMCCSSSEGGREFWHSYNSELAEMLPCDYIDTFTSKDFNSSRSLWKSGVEIGWGKADEEPLCGEQEDCKYWPNSTCSNTTTEDDKRCICNNNFRWDVSKQSCVQDAYGHSKASSEKLMQQNKRLGLVIAVNVVLSVCVVAAVVLCFMRRMASRKRSSRASVFIPLLRGDEGEDIDLPMLQFEVIVTSTENFSLSNKLGQGGFGPVYKGQLPGGQEVAVKRLSQRSCQGVDEFKNELVLIAKLQHRNLVRLLGYCVEGDERILIYEYMPNRSLDFFLFDSDRSKHLGWKTRFNIILGITRGLLYLHQDSRLRIIHRDLKTSNILLDDEMNPKISDFGLARIFGGQEVEANTNRVVGTFGYMSPEYASHGSFSIKSDVFSFGVILLEVITGQRNACFYHSEQQYSLLGHAWELWKENKGLELVDQDIMEWNDEEEVLKCIQLGLLCVQENPNDRPPMASVLGMLVNENASFTMPKKPAFAQSYSGSQSSSAVLQSFSTDPRNISINKGTTSTELVGR